MKLDKVLSVPVEENVKGKTKRRIESVVSAGVGAKNKVEPNQDVAGESHKPRYLWITYGVLLLLICNY